ncbi:MAG: methyltransferase, partial [Planctomycetes bacterium]|nr:methyltransferase [Planctomycetota bacterium]
METPEPTYLDDELFELLGRKTIEWSAAGRPLRLAVPVDVFSGFQVDLGTRRLVRQIDRSGAGWERVLDLGCGYGAVGLYLAAAGRARHVCAVDRDALAAAFCARNAAANGLERVTARGGLDYDALPAGGFDAVVANVPAKAGPPVHRAMLLGASRVLRDGGEVWIVVVEPLAGRVDEILSDPAVELRAKVPLRGHVVYRFGFAGRCELPARPYVRRRGEFTWRDRRYVMTCLHGLAGFDRRGRAADLAVSLFSRLEAARRARELVVCEPGQGHVAVLAAGLAAGAERVVLVSRDRLALRASRANLLQNGWTGPVEQVHSVDFAASASVLAAGGGSAEGSAGGPALAGTFATTASNPP